jgi:hypothetical protein
MVTANNIVGVDRMEYREVRWRRNRNNSMDTRMGSIHGTSFRGLHIVWLTLLTAKFVNGHISEAIYFRSHSQNLILKNSFTTLKAYINVFRGHVQCFELS